MNLANLAAVVVGASFVYAGVSKLLMGREWPRAAARLGVPTWLAALVVPAEVVIGLGVIVADRLRQGFIVAAGVLLVAFTALLLWHLRSDSPPPCACFGASKQRPIAARDVVRNVVLLVLVLVALGS
ncbi:MAG: MauE/DoxX family redox-associated membrane protein [Ilumatobacteraceae bacterium]